MPPKQDLAVGSPSPPCPLCPSPLSTLLTPHSSPSSPHRYASQQDLTIMRKVYDFCSQRGVYPEISQFNRMMDWYTVEFRFGEVVSLACDMVRGGRASTRPPTP